MTGGITVKVCGLKHMADVETAMDEGADFLGAIFYSRSPRALERMEFERMAKSIPDARWVYVDVNPSPGALKWAVNAGFSACQIHFSLPYAKDWLESLKERIERPRLWLAPRVPPGTSFPDELLPYADTVVRDTYQAGSFGGSGETGDWTGFRALKQKYPSKTWVLAGGLSPENISEALIRSRAAFVDVNSGVESAPGKKDPEKVRAFFRALRAAGNGS